jgi:signal transduction histidine kinase/putative methionine-R-sulfoxide reductase with GAF domain
VEPIISYATLPIEYLGHVLGTLSVHFDDDSLYSQAKREFLTGIAKALGSALGSFEWAHQRRAVAEHGRALDEMMFARSPLTPLDEEERRIVGQAARMLFELTAAEMVLYYRYSAQARMLRLIATATHDGLLSGRTPPSEISADVGVVGQAVTTRRGQVVNDYCDDRWRDVRAGLLAAFPGGSERAFYDWVRSEVAWPVLADTRVQGALVALSGIPKWLTAQDVEIVSELAAKTGLCLEVKHLTHQFDWQVHAKIAINQITATMALSSKEDELYRLLLLAITAGECLGFNRAVLLLPRNGNKQCFEAALAVGPSTGPAAETQWRDASGLALSQKIEVCRHPPQRPRSGELQAQLSGIELDIGQHPKINANFAQGNMAVRRLGEPHLILSPEWQAILCPCNDDNIEYVLVPLKAAGEIIAVVVADLAFLPGREIPNHTLRLLQLLADEFGLILAALKQRQKEEETRIAEQLTRGVSYGLGSRVGLLEAGMSLLKDELQGQHAEAVARLERDITFFKRSSALSSGLLRVRRSGVEKGRPFDLNQTLASLIAVFQDPRIEFRHSTSPVTICADPARVEDVFLEILLNARDFTDPVNGRICVISESAGHLARVFVHDNGPGIHPDVRDQLFEAFQCYPRSRRGLGLAYARALAEAYGGDIELIPTPEAGAHFLVTLPLAQEPVQ